MGEFYLREQCFAQKVQWILEVDLRKFFDTVDHRQMRELLSRRVQDGVINRLIGKWLKAGVWEKGEVSYPNRLVFDRFYQVFRELLLPFEPVRRLACVGDIGGIKDYAALLAASCENHGIPLPDGSRPLEFYRECFSKPSSHDFRKRVAAAQLSLNQISFAELFPACWPAIHLVPNAEDPPDQTTNQNIESSTDQTINQHHQPNIEPSTDQPLNHHHHQL